MGRQIIWDGRGLPEVGDEVLFEVASRAETLQRGEVVRFEVSQLDKENLPCRRIEVHMTCRSGRQEWPNMRFLEEVYPLTFRKEEKA
jgi:hypothetical protein